MKDKSLPLPVVLLGIAGVVPQAICLLLVLSGEPYKWVGLAAGCFYAAVILSFLGGMWWMAALLSARTEPALYVMAIIPSLAGWAALLPWIAGMAWPGPSLFALGLILLISPLADVLLAQRVKLPSGWIGLRVMMASGLGLLTLALAIPMG